MGRKKVASNKNYHDSIGNPKLELSYCAFIDILGFKDLIINASNDAQIFNEFITIFKNEIERISGKYFNEYQNWEVASFSDNIAIGVPLYSQDGESECGHILGLISDYQMAMSLKGYFIRGGLSIGNLYIGGQVIYGKPLIESYTLESKMAKVPRIILSKGVKKIVTSHMNYYSNPYDSPQNKELLIDKDGVVFINYLSELIYDSGLGYGVDWKSLDKHKKIVARKLKETKDNTVVWAKYQWVAKYHNYFCDQVKGYKGGSEKYKIKKGIYHKKGNLEFKGPDMNPVAALLKKKKYAPQQKIAT